MLLHTQTRLLTEDTTIILLSHYYGVVCVMFSFVVNNMREVIGVISLESICEELISREMKKRQTDYELAAEAEELTAAAATTEK